MLRTSQKPYMRLVDVKAITGIDIGTLSRIERGMKPTFEQQSLLAKLYGLEPPKPILKFQSQNNYTPANVAGKSRKR